MIPSLPFLPFWWFDIAGSLTMIVVSTLCLRLAWRFSRRHHEDPLAAYLLWFFGALFAFSCSRGLGHIVKYLLIFSGHGSLWTRLAPVSGSINSITFVVIGSVTLFFHRMQRIIARAARDRQRIEATSRDLAALNRQIETVVAERTRAEMALGLAHEIRNPAMIIGGLSRRLAKLAPAAADPKWREHIHALTAEAQRLEELVHRFEAATSAPGTAFQALDLNQLLLEVMPPLEEEARQRGVALVVDQAATPLNFQGNRDLLQRALSELLHRALENAGHGDMVEVGTALCDGGICLHLQAPAITSEEADGLPVYPRQVVEEHHGSLEISSEPGRPSRLTLRLPTHLGLLHQRHPT